MIENPLHLLAQSLPQSFPFYHLGTVELMPQSQVESSLPSLIDRTGIAFSFHGNINGWLVLLVENGLDLSVYSEVGNVIASKLATELSKEQAMEAMISPPKTLSDSALSALARSGHPFELRTYLHSDRGKTVRLDALILSVPQTEEGNA